MAIKIESGEFTERLGQPARLFRRGQDSEDSKFAKDPEADLHGYLIGSASHKFLEEQLSRAREAITAIVDELAGAERYSTPFATTPEAREAATEHASSLVEGLELLAEGSSIPKTEEDWTGVMSFLTVGIAQGASGSPIDMGIAESAAIVMLRFAENATRHSKLGPQIRDRYSDEIDTALHLVGELIGEHSNTRSLGEYTESQLSAHLEERVGEKVEVAEALQEMAGDVDDEALGEVLEYIETNTIQNAIKELGDFLSEYQSDKLIEISASFEEYQSELARVPYHQWDNRLEIQGEMDLLMLQAKLVVLAGERVQHESLQKIESLETFLHAYFLNAPLPEILQAIVSGERLSGPADIFVQMRAALELPVDMIPTPNGVDVRVLAPAQYLNLNVAETNTLLQLVRKEEVRQIAQEESDIFEGVDEDKLNQAVDSLFADTADLTLEGLAQSVIDRRQKEANEGMQVLSLLTQVDALQQQLTEAQRRLSQLEPQVETSIAFE